MERGKQACFVYFLQCQECRDDGVRGGEVKTSQGVPGIGIQTSGAELPQQVPEEGEDSAQG